MLKFYFPKWPPLFVIFLLVRAISFAQVTEQWVVRYTGPDAFFDGAHSLAVDATGNVFVTGQSVGENTLSDFITIKYDANGNELWARRYNGTASLDDGATFIAVDHSGNVYVTGWSFVSAEASVFVTIKYNAAGDEVWVRFYSGPGNALNSASALGIDALGNVYVTGQSKGLTSDDYATIKYDAAGNQIWVKRYDDTGNSAEYPFSLAVSPSGNVYVTGRSNGYYATLKYDTNGNELWRRVYGGNFATAKKIILDRDENVYITGESYDAATNFDFVTIKYNSLGGEFWVKKYNSPQNFRDQGISLGVDASGNVYVTGLSYPGPAALSDYVTLKYDAMGNEQWVRRYQGTTSGNDVPAALTVDAAGNSFVTGNSVSDRGDVDYATVGYNTEGDELWVKRYGARETSFDEAVDIAVDNSGNVFVTGTSSGFHSGEDIATIKYSRTSPLKVDAGKDAVIYFGYGSNCINLNAEASGGNPPYNYKWSPGDATSSAINVCLSATATYTVTVTDASGTISSDQIQVTVIDVRCQNDKIRVCHNGKELCIDRHAVEAHLKHGDKLGSVDCKKNEVVVKSFKIDITPNPFVNTTFIQYEVPEDGKLLIKIFDVNGKLVSTPVNADRKAGIYNQTLNTSTLKTGIYYYEAILITKKNSSVTSGKMIKLK